MELDSLYMKQEDLITTQCLLLIIYSFVLLPVPVYYGTLYISVLPFPVGCYRAQTLGSKGRSTQYRIFGHEKWRFWEVVSIYLGVYSRIGGIISIIALICSFFD